MKVTMSEDEFYNVKEIYFAPSDLNSIQHEFWMIVQKRKDVPEAEIYWLTTYKSSDQICKAIEQGNNLQKFFSRKQIQYILNSIKEGLSFIKDKR